MRPINQQPQCRASDKCRMGQLVTFCADILIDHKLAFSCCDAAICRISFAWDMEASAQWSVDMQCLMVTSLQSHLTYKLRNVFPPCSVLSSRVSCFVRILCGYPDRQHKYWIIKQPRTANILTSPAAPNIAELKQRACTKYVRRYSEVVVRLLSKFKKLLSRLVCFRYHVSSGILEIKRFNFYFLDLTGKYSDCIWYTDSQRAHNILPGWSDWRFT